MHSYLIFFLIIIAFHLSDPEEERFELLPPTARALWAHHSGCPAEGKNHFSSTSHTKSKTKSCLNLKKVSES